MRLVIRLDDYSPNRVAARWNAVETALLRLDIRPLVAVIPDDRHFGSARANERYWDDVREMQKRGWTIGQHGYTHELRPIAPGTPREVFFATKSEFVGRSVAEQLDRIARGWHVLAQQGVDSSVFVAPNHGFDEGTIAALSAFGNIRNISDGIGLSPYYERGLTWCPQIDWWFPRFKVGCRTICLHPSTMSDTQIRHLAAGLETHRNAIRSFDEVVPAGRMSSAPRLFNAWFRGYYTTINGAAALRARYKNRNRITGGGQH